ncbi:GNAT family N-acetyltransferase [candidate division KSB1 bacterium]|nr:GNAT family N-acetyltransferase [candidate division KSB1 bacterium]
MSSIEVERFVEADAAAWDDYVERTNNGTIFHSRRFLGYHPAGRFVDHSLWLTREGKRVALFPAVDLDLAGKRLLFSHRGASYGGIVYRNPLGISDAFEYVKALIDYARAAGFGGIDITPPPRCYVLKPTDYVEFALLQNGFAYRKREISSVITLDFNPESVAGTFSESSRRAVRKAVKSGVEVRESDDFHSFYHILERNLRLRHNVNPTHSLDELLMLKRLFPEKIKLFGAFYQGRMIAGVVMFECNPRAVLAFYISHDDDYQQVRSVNLLFHEIICWSIRERYKFFDFGIFTVNEDPNWGLGRFKESFGAQGIFRDSLQIFW